MFTYKKTLYQNLGPFVGPALANRIPPKALIC